MLGKKKRIRKFNSSRSGCYGHRCVVIVCSLRHCENKRGTEFLCKQKCLSLSVKRNANLGRQKTMEKPPFPAPHHQQCTADGSILIKMKHTVCKCLNFNGKIYADINSYIWPAFPHN